MKHSLPRPQGVQQRISSAAVRWLVGAIIAAVALAGAISMSHRVAHAQNDIGHDVEALFPQHQTGDITCLFLDAAGLGGFTSGSAPQVSPPLLTQVLRSGLTTGRFAVASAAHFLARAPPSP